MEKTSYLFVHFTGESESGEQIYFSLSRDGLHWEDVNHGEPVLRSDIGEKGVRDPFLIRDEKNGRFYLIATDLRIASGKGWEAAQFSGSRDMIVWSSEDLVHFSRPWSVTVGIPESGCVWAPEAVPDEKQQDFLVFWASMVEGKQRIYAAHTTDFVIFTKPELYIERENHVIDTDIVQTPEGYVRFSKDETTKTIRMEVGSDLEKESFVPVSSGLLDQLYGVEGPIAFYLHERKQWCLMVDRFHEGKGYLPLVTEHPASGKFAILPETEYDMGKNLKRHGGILPVTEEEADRIRSFYG